MYLKWYLCRIITGVTSSTLMFSLALVSNTRTPTDSPKRTASWVSTCFRAGSSFLFPTGREEGKFWFWFPLAASLVTNYAGRLKRSRRHSRKIKAEMLKTDWFLETDPGFYRRCRSSARSRSANASRWQRTRDWSRRKRWWRRGCSCSSCTQEQEKKKKKKESTQWRTCHNKSPENSHLICLVALTWMWWFGTSPDPPCPRSAASPARPRCPPSGS